MAIIKHKALKCSDYSAAIEYLEYEHEECSIENLKSEITLLSEQKNDLYEQRSLMKKELKDLENAKYNIQKLTEKDRLQDRERGVQEVSR